MKIRWNISLYPARAAAVLAAVVSVAGCDTSPTTPPLAQLPTDAVVVNGGRRFTGSQTIAIHVCVDDLDSVCVWNGSWDDRDTGTWFAATGGCVDIAAWGLGSEEGPVEVRVYARVGGLDTHSVATALILDLTPPLIPEEPLTPVVGAADVSVATGLEWPAATDAWSPADSVSYVVLAGNASTPTDTVYSGRDTACLVPGLVANSICYWQVIAKDAVGNAAVGPVWSFGTWSWGLPVFRAAPAGTYVMGSPGSEFGHLVNEVQHEVSLTRGFLIASTEIQVRQYLPLLTWAYARGYVEVHGDTVVSTAVAGNIPITYVNWSGNTITFAAGEFVSQYPNRILTGVSWYGATALSAWLNELSGVEVSEPGIGNWQNDIVNPYALTGYRLPTEAEWEYACRAGSTTAFANGEIGNDEWIDPVLGEIGWYYYNYTGFTFTPAQKIPNSWGLFDMHGGTPEWCWDWYGLYSPEPEIDPVNVKYDPVGDIRVLRGTLPVAGPKTIHCRSAYRSGYEPTGGAHDISTIRIVWAAGRPESTH